MSQVGFTTTTSGASVQSEAFYGEIIDGLGAVIANAGLRLLVQTVDDEDGEMAQLRDWHRRRSVDAVVLKDLRIDDPRPAALELLGLPFVVLGDTGRPTKYATAGVDNARAMSDCVTYLSDLGHHRILRVAGPPHLAHVVLRTDTFQDHAARIGLEVEVVNGDFSRESGYWAVATAMALADPPTAILFDNDLMALGGLDFAQSSDVPVPGRLSLIAWDDSVACQLADPPLSALSHDVRELGEALGHVILTILTGTDRPLITAAQPVIVNRSTTAAPLHTAFEGLT